MAYNVLKGTVEGSVDQHGNQEIDGVKIFKNTISASVFYDTDSKSPCATMKDVAVNKIVGATQGAILTFGKAGVANASFNLTFDGTTLKTKEVQAALIKGSGAGLTNVPSDQFVGTIGAHHIKLGNGLTNVRGNVQVKAHEGVAIDRNGISVVLARHGALSLQDNKVTIDISKTEDIARNGQNLSDSDLLVVTDTSHHQVAHTTLTNFYDGYIKNKIHHAAGKINEIQLKDKQGFVSSPHFSYDISTNTLKVDGNTHTENLKITGDIHCEGAMIQNIKTIASRIYEVQPMDYTLLCDAKECPVTVILPPACNHTGRVLIIKKTNSDKYKINSYPVLLKVNEGTIDLRDEMTLRTNYSVCSVQSDGENWWVISAKGN
tara:strand:+ start:4440 stop:5567 length:1128 start_codon:yes stop_codon:yes gene_type:complete